jgi:outer membrane protein assembly factor BamE (lipoprotein component of BamABCDE complex)
MNMHHARFHFFAAICAALMVVALPACNRSLSGSKLTLDNYNQISTGMSKAQVERILGPPTSMETKDMLIYKKTVYRYEDGKKFAIITFKNDEVDSKDTNLGTGA